MAEQANLDKRVTERLNALHIDPASLDGKTRRQLNAIEQAIQNENERREQAQTEAAKHRLTVSNISKASGIGRTTIYDNETLKTYIEDCQNDDETKTARRDSSRLQQRIDAMKKQIAAMEKRDGKLVVLEAENRQLKERVSRLEQLITTTQQEQTQTNPKATVLSIEDYREQKTKKQQH